MISGADGGACGVRKRTAAGEAGEARKSRAAQLGAEVQFCYYDLDAHGAIV